MEEKNWQPLGSQIFFVEKEKTGHPRGLRIHLGRGKMATLRIPLVREKKTGNPWGLKFFLVERETGHSRGLTVSGFLLREKKWQPWRSQDYSSERENLATLGVSVFSL